MIELPQQQGHQPQCIWMVLDKQNVQVAERLWIRPCRVAKNIQVRRAAHALAKASDLHEVFEAIRHMLEFGEFSFANAQVGQAGHADANERAFQISILRYPKQELEMRTGRVYWSWVGDDGEADEKLRARSSWSFRLPLVKDGVEWGWLNLYHNLEGESLLVDTNYLSNLFLREFTEAVTRIIGVHEPSEVAQEISIGATANQIGR